MIAAVSIAGTSTQINESSYAYLTREVRTAAESIADALGEPAGAEVLLPRAASCVASSAG